jgi:hypothetical protein
MRPAEESLAQRVDDGRALALAAVFAAEQAARIERELEHEFDGQMNWDHEGAQRIGLWRLNDALDRLRSMLGDERRRTDVEHGRAFDELRRNSFGG